MPDPKPRVVIIGGPNGAGKSTSAPKLLRGPLRVDEFVNADAIARGLSEFRPESVALEACRALIKRVHDLADRRMNFAFEATLASRTFAPFVKQLVESGYEFYLLYVWVPGSELCLARVAQRVRSGGHHVPDGTVLRRYGAGMKNFFELYRPLAERGRWYNNSRVGWPTLVTSGKGVKNERVYDSKAWSDIKSRLGSL